MKNKNYFILLVLFLSALQIKAQYSFDNVLYGAAYYHEYMPYERLDEDIRLMKRAGLTVVRVGESAWGVFEPQEGNFEFEWMDRILDKMHAAGIKVILGTPTYSIPAWLAYKHPEVLAEHAKGNKAYYGIRQNMDFTNPTYQFYCERIIRKMLERYAQHPAVIGYQVDNETEARGVNNRDYFFGFRNYIKQKFNNDLNLLAKEWGMNYWGMNINTWEEFYPRDGVTSPSYKNEWERYNRKEVADFLNWQCDLVNEYKRKDQFVTHCFMPDFHNIDQVESFRQMQYPAINVYHDVQDKQDGQRIAYAGDFVRTVADNAALRRLADSIRLPRKEFFTFTTERGDTLGGYIVRPAGFDPARRYPCLLTQYSGPGSQTVQNRWKLDWEDVLAQRGYVVVATDGRGTGYRGEAFKKSTYGQLGRLEVEDQLSTARYMAAQPWIDAERIGIYGWSYGGFMALSCACKGDGLFKAAVAVAPVTSWRYYDTIYSELYNGLPQENPAGYNENAPLMLAPLLRDDRTRLLLIHGTADDNVHFQNSAEMIRALTDAGKEFDLMIYPDQNHSMQPDYTRQIRQRMISFVERNL